MDARDQIPPRLFALFADGVCRAGGWFIFFATSRLTRARPSRNSDQARTALRRGAPLLKYCRNAKPHVSHFQLSADEARLEWVGKNAKTKGVPMAAVADALPGRASEVFRKWASLEAEHPPEVCLSVRYEIQENQKAKTKRFRTLDLVFEDPARAAVWRAGIAAAARRARAAATPDASGPDDAAPDKGVTVGSSTNTTNNTMKSTMLASRAVSRFKRSRGGKDGGSGSGPSGPGASAARDVIAEPGDAFVWGRVAAIDGGGAFGAFGFGGFGGDEGESLNDVTDRPSVGFATPRRVAGTDGIDVTAVALGASHVAAVVDRRHVYTWGEGRGGRLGQGSHAARAMPTKLRGVAVDAAGLGGASGAGADGDVRVCCGGSVTFAVSGDGRCFSWGDAEGGSASVFGARRDGAFGGAFGGAPSRWTPAPIRFPGDRKVTLVSASRCHVAALAADGALFTWGENAFGALGVEEIAAEKEKEEKEKEKETTTTKFRFRENARATPTRVEALAGKRVTSVSCGRWHTAAVADGEVYAWGDADGGKLGRECLTLDVADVQRELPGSSSGGGAAPERGGLTRRTPARVARGSDLAPVAHISCGTWHTLFSTVDGALYILGAVGGADVAGSVEEAPARVTLAKTVGETDPDGVFQKRSIPKKASVTLVASGELHAAVVVVAEASDDRVPDVAGVYTWGSGKRGALGHGDTLDQPFPKRVAALAGREVRRVTCGPDATACVVSPRAATNREKASVAKAGSRLTRRFDASVRGTIGFRERSAIDVGDGLKESTAIAARRSKESASAESLSRVSGASARSSEMREGSTRGGSGAGGGEIGFVVVSETESASSEAERRSAFAFATRRPIGARVDENWSDASLADADAARAAAARARRDAASAAAERDALRMEVASLRAALRLAERAGDATGPRPPVREPSVSVRDVVPAPAAALAEAAKEEADTLAAFARGGDRDEPAPLVVVAPVPPVATTPVVAAARVLPVATTPVVAAARVPPVATTPVVAAAHVPPVATTPVVAATPAAAAAPRTPPDAGTPDVGTPGTESRRPAPSPSPSPSPNPATPGSGSGTPDSRSSWVEEIEPGVFMTISRDATTGHHVLRRVRFSKRVFSDTEATAWWTKNRARVIRARGLKVSR